MLSYADSPLLGKRRANPDIPLTALLAFEPSFDRSNISRQIAPDRIITECSCVQLGAVAAFSANGLHRIAVTSVVADFVEALAPHFIPVF